MPIRIRAQFTALGPGILGSAGPVNAFINFPNAPKPNVIYYSALANKLAGVDLAPGQDDINANFSTNFTFYLGLDNNHGPLNDLVTVLLHEFAHGLGFSQQANLTTGALLAGFPDQYNSFLFDNVLGKFWPQMTNAERAASAIRWGKVVLDAPFTNAGVPNVLSFGSPAVDVNPPSSLAGTYQFGTAAFGPAIGSPNVTAPAIAAVDAVEAGPTPGTTTDGCSPFSNAGAVAGKIVLIERGFCGFAVKARNATNAGAAGVDHLQQRRECRGCAPGMADDGINGAFVTIPTVSLSRADGLAIVGQLASGISMDIGVDPAVRAGADPLGRARVYAPFPIVGGSSISHYDTLARRNLLMEPAINAGPDAQREGAVRPDVRVPPRHRLDVPRRRCRRRGRRRGLQPELEPRADDRDRRHRLRGARTTCSRPGAPAPISSPHLAAASTNHGSFVSGIAHLTNEWKADGLISGRDKGAIQSAAARSN